MAPEEVENGLHSFISNFNLWKVVHKVADCAFASRFFIELNRTLGVLQICILLVYEHKKLQILPLREQSGHGNTINVCY